MNFSRKIALGFIGVLVLALGFEIGVRYEAQKYSSERARYEEFFTVKSGSGSAAEGDPEKQADLTLFWSVWRLLQRHYVDPARLDVRNMVFGAIGGMVDGIGDPYTVFMTPQATKAFDDSLAGTLEGIGAQLDEQDGDIVVVAPIKGSPAEKAGLQPKDIIVKVGDTATAGMILEDVVNLIRGPRGTPVTLTVIREKTAAPIVLSMTRQAIHIPSVESSVKKTSSGSVGVVTLNQFGDDSTKEIREAITAFPKDIKGIVLDLRYNGGGYLEGAVELVSMFIAQGEVVTVERRGVDPEVHVVSGQALVPDLPLVVLVNGGSASASEITAGALQDLKRAKIVGTQSFGKGTVQEIIDLPGGSALRVTIAHWLTPNGSEISQKGITPDVIIDRTIEDQKNGRDPQLDTAVAQLFHR